MYKFPAYKQYKCYARVKIILYKYPFYIRRISLQYIFVKLLFYAYYVFANLTAISEMCDGGFACIRKIQFEI